MKTPCPLCGDLYAAKFDPKSDWCVGCVEDTLQEQKASDTDVIAPQVFGE